MEFFHRAKAVRLKSQHSKFLAADEDEESVKQQSNGAAPAARWTVEFVEGKTNTIRLKSSKSWKYLAASDEPFLLGWTGKRVVQASPRMKSDASVEWEPIKEGMYVKLRAKRGTFLRANGTIPPWRNSITHDMPTRTATQDWVLWVVDILEIDHKVAVGAEEEKEKKMVNGPNSNLKQNNSFGSDGGGDEQVRTSSVYSNSMGEGVGRGGGIGSPAGSIRSVRTPSPQRQVEDSFSRSSSTSSNKETPISSYAATPASSERTEEVSASVQKLRNDSSKNAKLSNSFNNLESVIADADEVLGGRKQKKQPKEDPPSSSRSLPLEVRMAKQTLMEAKDLDLESVFSSGRLKRIEKAISVLLSYDNSTRASNSKLLSIRDQFKTLKSNRERAANELKEYEDFSGKKAEMKAELQKEVGKARELQSREMELCGVLEEARGRREELLRELEKVEREIRKAEEEQAEDEAEIEELCGLIEMQSKGVKEMEMEENLWLNRKAGAERRLEQVEDDWAMIKLSFQMFEC